MWKWLISAVALLLVLLEPISKLPAAVDPI
jgi:hypothetical protein